MPVSINSESWFLSLLKAGRSTSYSFPSQPSESLRFRVTTVELVRRSTIELNVDVIEVPQPRVVIDTDDTMKFH